MRFIRPEPLPADVVDGTSVSAYRPTLNWIGHIWPRISPPLLLAVWMLIYVSPPRTNPICSGVSVTDPEIAPLVPLGVARPTSTPVDVVVSAGPWMWAIVAPEVKPE